MEKIDLPLARKIIQDFDLNPNTLKVWNSRGAIPKKYLDGTAFKKEGKITPREMSRMVEVLANPKINLNRFFENCSTIRVTDYHDYVKIGAQIDRVQYVEIKKLLNKLRIEIKRLASSQNFNTDLKKWLDQNPELKKRLLLDQKALYFKQGKVVNINEPYYRDRLALFLLESVLI